MKKLVILICIGMYICFSSVYAMDYLVMDSYSGRVLEESNGYEQNSIASLTKVMTSIILLENADLKDKVIVPKMTIGGSEIGLKEGDKMTVYDILCGMLVASGNDAAITTAIHVAGSIEEFTKLMNKKAKEIGCYNTNFVNPHGLDNENHYSTAYDMALITRYAMKFDKINEIINSTSVNININGNVKTLRNTNALLKEEGYIDGVKTGYTSNADRCLITSASDNDFRIISVLLGAPTTELRFSKSLELINNNLFKYELIDISDVMNFNVHIDVEDSETKYLEYNFKDSMIYPLTKEERVDLNVEYNTVEYITAPLNKGESLRKY